MRIALLVFCAAALVACERGPSPSPSAEPLGVASAAPHHEHATHEPSAAPHHEPATAQPSPARAAYDPASPHVGGLTFRAPEPLTHRPPSAPMRAAEYIVAGASGGEPALLVIHHFPGMGGSTESNLARWLGQFSQPDGRDSRDVARIESATVNGLEVARVDVTGTYVGMSPTGAAEAPRAGHRLVGAIAQGPEGPVFFKLVGPAALVDLAMPAFEELLQSLAPLS